MHSARHARRPSRLPSLSLSGQGGSGALGVGERYSLCGQFIIGRDGQWRCRGAAAAGDVPGGDEGIGRVAGPGQPLPFWDESRVLIGEAKRSPVKKETADQRKVRVRSRAAASGSAPTGVWCSRSSYLCVRLTLPLFLFRARHWSPGAATRHVEQATGAGGCQGCQRGRHGHAELARTEAQGQHAAVVTTNAVSARHSCSRGTVRRPHASEHGLYAIVCSGGVPSQGAGAWLVRG